MSGELKNSIGNVIDYYENSAEINILSLESINADNCNTTGQLTFKGSFSKNFEEQINFNLNLTYPNTELKCELNKVSENTLTTIKCATQEKLLSIGNILIEEKIIKKKDKELFLIKGKSFNFEEKRACENYDTVRQNLLEKRMNSGISFSLMSNLEVVNQILEFFMAFSRDSSEISFDSFYKFNMSLFLSTRRNLRSLEENTISDVPIICTLNENLALDSTAGYNCNSESVKIQGNVLSFGIDNTDDMNISGIDNVNTQGSKDFNINIDFFDLNVLKEINNLPYINITHINGESCINNGQYIIYGNISNASAIEEKYLNIKILMSSSKSQGVCEAEINKDNSTIKMICQNSDKFSFSKIIIETSIIYDSKGKMIFKINKFNSPEKFSCGISTLIPYVELISTPTSEQSYKLINELSNSIIIDSSNISILETTNNQIEETTDKPNNDSTDKPNDDYTDKPNDDYTDKPNDDYTDKTNDDYTDKNNDDYTDKNNDDYTDKINDDYTD